MIQKAREDFAAWCSSMKVKDEDKDRFWMAFYAGWEAARCRVEAAIE